MRRTKIVCTIGPASENLTTLQAMVKAGMDVARLNMSHGTKDWHKKAIQNLRSLETKLQKPLPILLDLQGPKVRVGKLPEQGKELRPKEIVIFTTKQESSEGKIPVDYPKLAEEIKVGDRLLLADGLLECRVQKIAKDDIYAEVIVGGTLFSRKTINLPDTTISLRSLTPKDKEDLYFGILQDVDFIALSFVREVSDVLDLKKLIQKHCQKLKKENNFRVIAKIEKHEAVKNFDGILENVDGIMVARGDLAQEIPLADLPVVQKMIIEKCRKAGKPVIVATEMLSSMEKNPRPTRAEISDVGHAVFDHADATMLSGESATGKYPVLAVQTMAKIIEEAEVSPFDDLELGGGFLNIRSDRENVATLASVLARLSQAKALFVGTKSGLSVSFISRTRPEIPIIATSDSKKLCRQMNLFWGVYPFYLKFESNQEKMLGKIRQKTKKFLSLSKGDKIVFLNRWQENDNFNNAIILKTI